MRVWCNGEIIEPVAPALTIEDHGITVGDGVFEALKVVDNAVFALSRHLRRMSRSARGLGLPEPDHDVVRQAVKATLADQDIAHGLVRITYTAGRSPLGSERGDGPPTLIVATFPSAPRPESTGVAVVPWPRNERGALAGLKTTSYAENVLALAYARERGGTEALFANTVGSLCEGTGSNVFCVFGDAVVTPPLSAGCLAGITRELVLEWCDVEERDLTMDEFAAADEAFLTSTTRDVQLIDAVDGVRRSGGDRVTAEIAAEWRRREALDVDP